VTLEPSLELLVVNPALALELQRGPDLLLRARLEVEHEEQGLDVELCKGGGAVVQRLGGIMVLRGGGLFGRLRSTGLLVPGKRGLLEGRRQQFHHWVLLRRNLVLESRVLRNLRRSSGELCWQRLVMGLARVCSSLPVGSAFASVGLLDGRLDHLLLLTLFLKVFSQDRECLLLFFSHERRLREGHRRSQLTFH